jgi:hypothetical protein
MKLTIEENAEHKNEITYPVLMQSTTTGDIYLFFSKNTATKLDEGIPRVFYEISNFILFDGTVTLSNK